jgi:hypothetical protein
VYAGEKSLKRGDGSTAVFPDIGEGGTDGKQTGLSEATVKTKPGSIQNIKPGVSATIL